MRKETRKISSLSEGYGLALQTLSIVNANRDGVFDAYARERQLVQERSGVNPKDNTVLCLGVVHPTTGDGLPLMVALSKNQTLHISDHGSGMASVYLDFLVRANSLVMSNCSRGESKVNSGGVVTTRENKKAKSTVSITIDEYGIVDNDTGERYNPEGWPAIIANG